MLLLKLLYGLLREDDSGLAAFRLPESVLLIDGKYADLATPSCAACCLALAQASRVCGLLHKAEFATSARLSGLLKSGAVHS